MIPSIGRIVHYKLSAQDALDIYHRRGQEPALLRGNSVAEGHIYPAVIVRIWGRNEESAVQLQVLLDGTDTYWATSRTQGEACGQWSAPPRV